MPSVCLDAVIFNYPVIKIFYKISCNVKNNWLHFLLKKQDLQ